MTGAHPVGGPAVRPATPDDVPALTELYREVDTHWFGAPEHDESEVAEELGLIDDLTADTRLGFDGDRLVSAALRGRHESVVLVRPGTASGPSHDEALGWVAQRLPARIEVLDRDEDLLAALTARHWRHAHSAFELSRAVSTDWPASTPGWPAGVELHEARTDDLEDVHRLVYAEAGFGDVAGHVVRELDDWRRLIVGERSVRDSVVLARRGDRFVGAALVRTFSDGLGWISQLAVVPDERRRGLGRSLVLESFGRLVSTGATSLGLGVSAANRGALGLYQSLGLNIDREWQIWDAPPAD